MIRWVLKERPRFFFSHGTIGYKHKVDKLMEKVLVVYDERLDIQDRRSGEINGGCQICWEKLLEEQRDKN